MYYWYIIQWRGFKVKCASFIYLSTNLKAICMDVPKKYNNLIDKGVFNEHCPSVCNFFTFPPFPKIHWTNNNQPLHSVFLSKENFISLLSKESGPFQRKDSSDITKIYRWFKKSFPEPLTSISTKNILG